MKFNEILVANLSLRIRENSNIGLVSCHLWRGFNRGTAPTIEPTIELQIGKFTVGAWGRTHSTKVIRK